MRLNRRAALILPLALAAATACKKAEAPPPPLPGVKAATVLHRDVPIYVEAIGQTRGSTEIEIRARVEGFIRSVNYKEGMPVTKGQLLYVIDPQPFEASLAQANGQRAQAAAQRVRTHQDVVRYKPLVEKNAISREEYETAVAQEQAAVAAEAAAAANAQSARLNLSYARITAPDNGMAGKTLVYPGSLVGRGESTLLTHISQIDPIHVRFTIAERDYLRMARRKSAAEGGGGEPIPLELILSDGSTLPDKGRMVFVDRNVDPLTGTILLEAAFPNPGGLVRPGQYGRVRAAVETRPGAILIPQRAVQELQGTYQVALVGADGAVEFRPVVPGERIGPLWVIDSGLKPGEQVIVEGVQKVRAGSKANVEVVQIQDIPAAAPPPPVAADPAKRASES